MRCGVPKRGIIVGLAVAMCVGLMACDRGTRLPARPLVETGLVLRSSHARENARLIRNHPDLESLVIERTANMGSEVWSLVAGSTSIRQVIIRGGYGGDRLALARISPAGLRAIASLTELRHLELVNVAVDLDALLPAIHRPDRLQRLLLMNVQPGLDGDMFGRLRLSDLSELSVEAMLVDGELLRALHGLPSLRRVSLSHGRLSAEGLSPLRGHPTVQELLVINVQVPVSVEDVRACARCPNLRFLTFGGTPMERGSVRGLESADALRVLDLGSVSVSLEEAAMLAGRPALESLGLRGARFSRGALRALAASETLTHIEVPSISAEEFAELAACASLRVLVAPEEDAAVAAFRRLRPDVSVMIVEG